MGVETSNKKTEHSDQSNRIFAVGKRKEESDSPALSLQDVFSDPANLEGMQQKTSCLSANEQENEAQLRVKKIRKSKHQRGGRKKIPPVELKTKKLQMYMTVEEYNTFLKQYKLSGRNTMADYLRTLVLDEKSARSMVDRVLLIRHLDFSGTQAARIGNNINQLAKYAIIK